MGVPRARVDNVPPVLQAEELQRMPKPLLDSLKRFGFAGPVKGPSKAEMEKYCSDFANIEQKHGPIAKTERLDHGHVTWPFLQALVCHPTLVGAVASVLGTDTVLLYSSALLL